MVPPDFAVPSRERPLRVRGPPPEDSSPITGAIRLGLLRTISFSTGGSEAFFGGALDSPSQLPETLCNPSVRVLALIDAFTYELVGRNNTRHRGGLSSDGFGSPNLLDVIDHVVGDWNAGGVHEAVEFGRVVELVD